MSTLIKVDEKITAIVEGLQRRQVSSSTTTTRSPNWLKIIHACLFEYGLPLNVLSLQRPKYFKESLRVEQTTLGMKIRVKGGVLVNY